jgi:outer membrane autotransporter protein
MTTGKTEYGAVLRGGRMTKHKGQVASYAPMMGWALSCASTLALGVAATLGGSAAIAGSCTETSPGVFECAGPEDDSTDVTQAFLSTDGLTVTTEPEFGINTSSSDAFDLQGADVDFRDDNESFIAANGTAITASAGTGSLSIVSNGTIRGNQAGITASNTGSGPTNISVGTVAAGGGSAITASIEGAGLTITAGNVTSQDLFGVVALHSGTGASSISTASVSAQEVGILATTGSSGTGLSVTSTGTVTSTSSYGIFSYHRGSGAQSINTAAVNGNGLDGIKAQQAAEGSDLSITASGPVTGGRRGIDVFSEGSGTVTLNVADVSGGRYQGIQAIGGAAGMSITSSGLVRGQTDGIYASNRFGEALTIDVVDVQGVTGAAINARSGAEVVSITTTGNVVGATYGIKTATSGAGTQQITVSGEVSTTGGNLGEVPFSGVAIQIDTFGQTGQTVIDLQDGAQIQNERTDLAIREQGGGDTSLILRDGAALAGSVDLGSGDDSVTIEGGADISLVSRIEGGFLDEDALIFSGFTGVFEAEKFDSFETLTAQDGGNLTVNSADLGGFTSIQINSGAAITAQNPGFSFANDVSIGVGGRFLDGTLEQNTISLGGNVLNDGLISLADGGIGDSLTVGGDLSGSGTIGLDVNLTTGTHDQVQVDGNTAGATQGLDVDATGSTVDTAQNFTLVTVAGNSTESDFQLVNADFVTNDGAQAISDGDLAYRLIYDDAAGTYVLTPFAPESEGGGSGGVTENPGGAFFAAGVQQANDQLTFGSTLQRVMGSTQRGASDANTVSRALNELTSTKRPLVWVQGEGRRDSYSVDDRDVETNSGGLRFGAALPLTELINGTLIGGVEVGISSLSTDVTTSLTGADISTDAYDVTLSALWVADSLLYVDGQMRYGDFDSTTRPNGGQSVDTDSDGYGLSIEVGKPYGLGNGLTLVPQAQLMYSDIDADNVADLAGGDQTGSLEDGDTLTARLGLRAEHTLSGNAVLFGQVDYYHAFDNETAVAFGQNTVLTERGKNSAGLTLGGNVALSDSTTLFGELTGETGFGSNSSDYAFGGNIGFEFRF